MDNIQEFQRRLDGFLGKEKTGVDKSIKRKNYKGARYHLYGWEALAQYSTECENPRISENNIRRFSEKPVREVLLEDVALYESYIEKTAISIDEVSIEHLPEGWANSHPKGSLVVEDHLQSIIRLQEYIETIEQFLGEHYPE